MPDKIMPSSRGPYIAPKSTETPVAAMALMTVEEMWSVDACVSVCHSRYLYLACGSHRDRSIILLKNRAHTVVHPPCPPCKWKYGYCQLGVYIRPAVRTNSFATWSICSQGGGRQRRRGDFVTNARSSETNPETSRNSQLTALPLES